ncbi:uncharacterized protein Z520_00089 [Fonsecaea multimorphosa CBS 102226]|uniref:Uncharacterized protein n=1 Tax=Fonsecaea multimorphosa CBS 102226 TaxID=1442371 RepID=A0A0D2KBJ5_9EURO|nr:uncharacterized protein Z520_00089 [Fonsecaea multimorphosa CBS 102226]KIY03398.1 hypothetical protein Z520_00089 [Fonsecaea multimorphosa CBS 102226]OAL33047.1 hypothetical protein AYO22_00132 [Fonsecaea multimorphosa]
MPFLKLVPVERPATPLAQLSATTTGTSTATSNGNASKSEQPLLKHSSTQTTKEDSNLDTCTGCKYLKLTPETNTSIAARAQAQAEAPKSSTRVEQEIHGDDKAAGAQEK